MSTTVFKIGDYVKVSPSEDIDDYVEGWEGEITEIFDPVAEGEEDDDLIITVTLDAQSLDEMDKDYVFDEIDMFGSAEDLHFICCSPSELSLSKRRDTDEMRAKALERVMEIAAKHK
jgi:hypothetical protein